MAAKIGAQGFQEQSARPRGNLKSRLQVRRRLRATRRRPGDFLDFFAGAGGLTAAARRLGLAAKAPEGYRDQMGGTAA